MPRITRWFIKSGMIYFMLGILLALISEFPAVDSGSLLLPVYWHMLVLGWITQIIMGVSIWMFPRRKRNRRKTETRKAFLAFWTLNAGLILRFTSEPFIQLFRNRVWMDGIVILSSLLLLAASLFYILEIWPRVFNRKRRSRSS